MLRVFISLLLLAFLLSGAYVLAGITTIISLYRYAGYEIVIIGALLDAYYVAFAEGVPVYTISAFILWSVAVVLKQSLFMYNTDHAPLS